MSFSENMLCQEELSTSIIARVRVEPVLAAMRCSSNNNKMGDNTTLQNARVFSFRGSWSDSFRIFTRHNMHVATLLKVDAVKNEVEDLTARLETRDRERKEQVGQILTSNAPERGQYHY